MDIDCEGVSLMTLIVCLYVEFADEAVNSSPAVYTVQYWMFTAQRASLRCPQRPKTNKSNLFCTSSSLTWNPAFTLRWRCVHNKQREQSDVDNREREPLHLQDGNSRSQGIMGKRMFVFWLMFVFMCRSLLWNVSTYLSCSSIVLYVLYFSYYLICISFHLYFNRGHCEGEPALEHKTSTQRNKYNQKED